MTPSGESDLRVLLKGLTPIYNPGDYVFCTISDGPIPPLDEIVMYFREAEGGTVILKKEVADRLHLPYSFVAGWITISIHSSLEAVGLTAAFSNALAAEGVNCNVVAAYYHDHIFVNKRDLRKAMEVLQSLSED